LTLFFVTGMVFSLIQDEVVRPAKKRRVNMIKDEDQENGDSEAVVKEDPSVFLEGLPDLDGDEEDVKPTERVKQEKDNNLGKVNAVEMTPSQKKNLRVPPSRPAVRGNRNGATLVVTPASLIAHWIEQIEMHVDKRVDLKVFVHYGQNKAQVKENQGKYFIFF